MAIFLHIREDVTQGDPLAMIAYRIGILPLINNIKQELPDITYPWYADDSRALGTFVRLKTYFYSLTHQYPGRGYHPKPSKSVLIVLPKILRPTIFLEDVTDFRCARVHIILGDTLRMTSPNVIGWESVCWSGRRTSAQSEKPRENIPRRVMPQWYVQSNQSGYFYNVSPGTQETRSRE